MTNEAEIDSRAVLEIFQKRGFETFYFENAAEANGFFESRINGASVGIGGSMTVKEMGLAEVLDKNNSVFWHMRSGDRADAAKAATADVYICSANAVGVTGEIVNIDGYGNRLSTTCCGAKEVWFVFGKNKLAPDLPGAIHRAKNIAAPRNAQRLGVKTPCAAKGDKCYKCNSPERICRATCIITHPLFSSKMHLVLINQDLGY